MTVQIQVIPPNVIAITNPNKAFSIAMQAQAEAKKYIDPQRKNLPLPRSSR